MDAVILSFNPPLQPDPAKVFPQPVIGWYMVAIEAIEWHGQVEEELGTVFSRSFADGIKYVQRSTVGISIRPEHLRRYCANQNNFSYTRSTMTTDIMCY